METTAIDKEIALGHQVLEDRKKWCSSQDYRRDILHDEAFAHFYKGKLSSALHRVEQILQFSNHAVYHNLRDQIHEQMENTNNMMNAKLNKPEELYQRSFEHLRSGALGAAMRDITKALKSKKKEQRYKELKKLIKLEKGNEKAKNIEKKLETELAQAIKMWEEGGDIENLFDCASLRFQLGEIDAAADAAAQVLRINPHKERYKKLQNVILDEKYTQITQEDIYTMHPRESINYALYLVGKWNTRARANDSREETVQRTIEKNNEALRVLRHIWYQTDEIKLLQVKFLVRIAAEYHQKRNYDEVLLQCNEILKVPHLWAWRQQVKTRVNALIKMGRLSDALEVVKEGNKAAQENFVEEADCWYPKLEKAIVHAINQN